MTGPEWKTDTELFALVERELYAPVVGDSLDQAGHYHQFLPAAVQPLRDSMKVIGRAMPALHVDVHGEQEQPFGRLIRPADVAHLVGYLLGDESVMMTGALIDFDQKCTTSRACASPLVLQRAVIPAGARPRRSRQPECLLCPAQLPAARCFRRVPPSDR